jgi:hypothetical protein
LINGDYGRREGVLVRERNRDEMRGRRRVDW